MVAVASSNVFSATAHPAAPSAEVGRNAVDKAARYHPPGEDTDTDRGEDGRKCPAVTVKSRQTDTQVPE